MIPRTLAAEVARAAAFRSSVRRFIRRTEEVTKEHGLTPHRYDLLLAVAAAPDGESNVTELCAQLQLPQPAVTQLVQRAVAAGLLARRRSEDDRRIAWLSLTADGERRLIGAFSALSAERQLVQAEIRSLDRTFRAAAAATRARR